MREVLSWLDENAERWMLLFLYSFIVLVIAIEVLRRFVLMYSSVWGEEAARYAFIYLVWIGAAVAVRDRAHIRIDVITHLLPPDRKSVVSGKGVSVRVDLGGRRIITKKRDTIHILQNTPYIKIVNTEHDQ